ncbi:hypothetical protein KY289_022990 [Solanum tuberosum]|nr:hypothetical protein KY289_022990 [Solanum tuberosum]
MDLPLPQNKKLTIRYEMSNGQSTSVNRNSVMFIPVLNKPLSSNQYYAIKTHGKNKGQAFTCSKEEDKKSLCFCRCVRDVKLKPLDPEEALQQFEICLYDICCKARGSFYAKSLAPDGFPPYFLRRKGWHLSAENPKKIELNYDAIGLNAELRQQLPQFNFASSYKSSEVVVGSCRDGSSFSLCQNDKINEGNSVLVDVALDTQVVLIAGTDKATWDDRNVMEGVIWFKSYGKDGNEVASLGLRHEIVERMKWEQQRGGWQNQGRIKQVEENRENSNRWRRLSCYVLVERFVLRRMDRSVVMTYDFKHIDKVKSIWD